MPGVVSPDLPSAFAHAAAYGDVIAAVLALLALVTLPSASGIVITWVFSVWGTVDLFNAFYQAKHTGLMAGQLGAAYFLPTFILPLLLITHGLSFRILLRHQHVPEVQEKPFGVSLTIPRNIFRPLGDSIGGIEGKEIARHGGSLMAKRQIPG